MLRYCSLVFVYLCLLHSAADAADAILFEGDAGQTLYARVYTSASTAVAKAFVAGTSGNTRRYAIDNSQFTLTDGPYVYTVFKGTPSTSATDEYVDSGIMYWLDGEARHPFLYGNTLVVPEEVFQEQAIATRVEVDNNSTKMASINTATGTTIPNQINGLPSATSIRDSVWSATSRILTANTNLGITPLQTVLDKVNAMIESSGPNYRYKEVALEEAPSASVGDVTTGGGLSFVAYAGTFERDPPITDVIQGEAKVITIAVQAKGSFADPTPTTITVKIKDSQGDVVTIDNGDITRITEDTSFQIIRFTVPAEDTAALAPGDLTLEASFDNEKVQIPGMFRIVEGL